MEALTRCMLITSIELYTFTRTGLVALMTYFEGHGRVAQNSQSCISSFEIECELTEHLLLLW